MNHKEAILKAIKANKPAIVPLPKIPEFNSSSGDLSSRYLASLEQNSGQWLEISDVIEADAEVKRLFPDAQVICSLVPEVEGNLDITTITDPHDLKEVDLAVLQTKIGVAENGAMWFSESMLQHRVLPFISQHLIILLEAGDIVPDMHHAYQKVTVNESGYGVFIAGPSKTADIEQSLVVGAHGARSLTVFLIKKSGGRAKPAPTILADQEEEV